MNIGNLNYNFFQLFILFISVHGVFFSTVVFLAKDYRSKSNNFLGLTVLFLSVSNIHHMLVDIGYLTQDSIIRKMYLPWHWLVAPMFYLFLYYFFNTKSLRKRYLFYLVLPVFCIATIHLSQYLYQLFINPDYLITKYYQRGLFLYTNLLSFVYIPLVIFLMYKMILDFEKNAVNEKALEKIKKETNWVKNLIYFGISITGLGMVSVIIGIKLNMKEAFYAYPFFISLSIWIYWMGYAGIRRSLSHKRIKKINNSPIPQKKGFNIFERINNYILLEKAYLKNDINRDVIAIKFGISTGYLSQIINQYAGNNFNDYINKLRVEASKKKLLDKQYDSYTIELIGLECGFKSKSNFYAAFKKHTGQTPNQFKKKNKS